MKFQRIESPPLPLNAHIDGGIKPHTSVEISGIVFQGQQGGFTIEYNKPSGTPLHISVRMGVSGERCIAFNHLKRGRWAREEHHHNPVQFGEPFVLKIINEHHKYDVHINGKHIAHYHMHSNSRKAHNFMLRGDLTVNYVQFNEHGKPNQSTIIQTLPPQPVIIQQPTVIQQQQPTVIPVAAQPVYVQQVVPTAPPLYPQIYAYNQQPEVIIMDGYHHHHHHHC